MSQWSGTGVPPVGAVVEYRHGSRDEWTRAQVLSKSEQYIVFRLDAVQPHWDPEDVPTKEAAPMLYNLEFRPVTLVNADKTVYLISELRVDPMENTLDKALWFEPIGYTTCRAHASYLSTVPYPMNGEILAWPLQMHQRHGTLVMQYKVEPIESIEGVI